MRMMILAAVLAFSTVLLLSASGCGNSVRPEAGQEQQCETVVAVLRDLGSAPAGLAVAESLRPFFVVGLGFVVLGGLALCFGGPGTGLTLMAVGAAATMAGVLFIQYPWIVLALALVAGLAALLAVHSRWRSRKALDDAAEKLARSGEAMEVLTEKIQNTKGGEQIKAQIKAAGPEAVNKVRKVVGPIKDKLIKEGRIKPA